MLGTPDKSLELPIPGTSRALNLSMKRKSSDAGDMSSKRRSKWTYAVVGLLGMVVLGLYMHSRNEAVRLDVEQSSAVLVGELDGAGEPARGRVAQDGSFLADLGPVAEEAYNLGPTTPDE
jgi:hypothetical protein